MREDRSILDHLFTSNEEITKERYLVRGDAFRHLAAVKRARPGERVTLSDGCGWRGLAVIAEITGDHIELLILERERVEREKPSLHLFQSIPKGGKMEEVIRKNVELGVDCFLPLISARCVVRGDSGDMGRKAERWRKVAVEEARQCRRDFLPEVYTAMSWSESLEAARNYPLCLVAWEKEVGQRIKDVLPARAPERIGLFVGPEGGFTLEEVDQLRDAGVMAVSLGKNILRTENAGIVMAALIRSHYGWL